MKYLRGWILGIAVVLSAIDGVLSWLSQLTFSDHETTALWMTTVIPTLFWLPALACIKFPRAGLVIFWLILGVSILFGVESWPGVHSWSVWANNFNESRFSIVAGFLLLGNLLLIVQERW